MEGTVVEGGRGGRGEEVGEIVHREDPRKYTHTCLSHWIFHHLPQSKDDQKHSKRSNETDAQVETAVSERR